MLENGLQLSRGRVPIGVIVVIYEACPNVTIDIASLCLKTGNASVLRGGRETSHFNLEHLEHLEHLELVRVIQHALAAVQYIDNPDRALVAELLRLDRYLDMIIPRVGAGLHKMRKENSSIQFIVGDFGISHIFVDESADLVLSLAVIDNAKVQRPSACNALDTLLAAADNLCEAGPEDFDTEWLGLTLGVKLVADIEKISGILVTPPDRAFCPGFEHIALPGEEGVTAAMSRPVAFHT